MLQSSSLSVQSHSNVLHPNTSAIQSHPKGEATAVFNYNLLKHNKTLLDHRFAIEKVNGCICVLWKVPFLEHALAKNSVLILAWNASTHSCAVETSLQEAACETQMVTSLVLAHLNKAWGPLQYLCSLGMESNPASCQYLCVLSCYLRMFLRREPEGGSEGGMDVSRAKNKSSIFPQLLQSLCLRIFQGKTKACLKQSFHQSCSCEQWSEPSSSFLINTDSQLSPCSGP